MYCSYHSAWGIIAMTANIHNKPADREYYKDWGRELKTKKLHLFFYCNLLVYIIFKP